MRETQHKGDIAVAQAVATFTKYGYDVSLPITESAAYDLIIDTAEGLVRIQVKYASTREVDLRRIHSNSNGYVVKKSKPGSYDWLYIFKNDGKEYLIKKCFFDRRSFTPKDEYLVCNVLKFYG